MRIIRRTQITWETRRILVTRATTRNAPDWCGVCGAPATWLNLLQAAVWREVPPTQIQAWLATGHLHTAPPAAHQLPDGQPLICLNSLLGLMEESLRRAGRVPTDEINPPANY